MFIVLLKFSENKSLAAKYMEAHNQWIQEGFENDIFLLVGSLQPNLGGSIMAHNISREALQSLIKKDPFVIEKIVTAEILEIAPVKTQERLNFLLDAS